MGGHGQALVWCHAQPLVRLFLEGIGSQKLNDAKGAGVGGCQSALLTGEHQVP